MPGRQSRRHGDPATQDVERTENVRLRFERVVVGDSDGPDRPPHPDTRGSTTLACYFACSTYMHASWTLSRQPPALKRVQSMVSTAANGTRETAEMSEQATYVAHGTA